jgi:GTP-binding protein
MTQRKDLRNIAIIAHVDHGKTTLVDAMFRQSGLFRDNQQIAERALDTNDLERERGITILSKNTAVKWHGVRINIVDTPGHADFGGEVERVLSMVSGALVLIDAAEGPMPQTRFVLSRALALSLPLVLVVNKTDRPDARAYEALEETQLLLMELGADDAQLDSPVIYASGRDGKAGPTPHDLKDDLSDLFDAILEHMPCPAGDETAPVRMQVSTIDYNDYVGRIAVGRIDRGTLKVGDPIAICTPEGNNNALPTKITSLMMFEGLTRVPVTQACVGDIVALSGIGEIEIGDTLTHPDHREPLPVMQVSEPTVVMTFSVNNGPFAGQEGQYVTSRQVFARLAKEDQVDMALRVEETERTDAFRVCGRGELHLSILVETMRREGYEFMVSKPEVIVHQGPDGRQEPMERLVIDVPEASVGAVMENLSRRKGELIDMKVHEGRTRMEYSIPSRGLFGFRGEMLTDTRGEGIMSAVFDTYGPWKGAMPGRRGGVLVATQTGDSVAYSLASAQNRGQLFIGPGERVYAGMIVGSSSRGEDISVNVCKGKNLTNTRSAAKDDNVILTPPRRFSLEEALAFLDDDELLEVTPKAFRLRKRILDLELRMKARKKKEAE